MIPAAIGGRAVADAATPIVARLAKHHKTLLNIVKHHETHVKHCEPPVKHLETLLKLCETSCNTRTLIIRCDNIGARCGDVGDRAALLAISALSFLEISAIGVLV